MSAFLVAAVQTSPVFLDVERTIDKVCSFVREAASRGARLVAFPEVFVAGYPYWAWLYDPIEGRRFFDAFERAAITVPGPWTDALGAIARDHGVVLVVGVNERSPSVRGCLYNTNVVFDERGVLRGRHRKLVPTHAERLVWGHGDGSGLRTYPTDCGRVGTLPCGENTNTLSRFALLAEGEDVHVANFPAFPFSDVYSEAEAIRIRCQAHAFEGKVFVVASTGLIDEGVLDGVCTSGALRERLEGSDFALSGVWGPTGAAVGEPVLDDEGIAYGTVDLSLIAPARLMQNIAGHYNQFSVLSLNVDRTEHRPAWFRDQAASRR